MVDDISHEGLRALLRKEEVSFQAIKTVKVSNDPLYEAKKNRVLELYDIAEGKAEPQPGDPTVVFSMDEFGPLNLLPRPGRQWAPVVGRHSKGTTAAPRRRRRLAIYKRTKGVRHLLAGLDMNQDKIYGYIKTNKKRTTFLAFCRYLRSLYPPEVRIAIVLDNFSPHLSTKTDHVLESGPRPTTWSWRTCLPTLRSSIGSSAISGRCAISRRMALTTVVTKSRA